MTRSILRGGIASAALAVSLFATSAQAADEGASTTEAIVVTAAKREQLLVDVPQAISVVSGDVLEAQHASNFADYVKLVPGLQLDESRAGQGRLVIRGVNTGGVASSVGVYMDETPFGSSSGLVNGAVLAADFDTFDLERVEVLRGPQGTVYGASSLSGVLKFVTRAPSTSGYEIRARAGVETTDGGDASYLGNLVVNVPLSDIAAVRASGFYRHNGGFVDSVGTGGSDIEDNINDSDVYGGRASLSIMPSDSVDLRFTAVLQNINADASSLVEADPDTFEILHGGLTQSQFVPEYSDLRYRLYNATGAFDLGFATLTSSSSYATQKQRLLNDYTFSLGSYLELATGIANESYQPQSTDNEKFTQEIRLAGESTMLDWLVGGYYTKETGLIEQDFLMADPATHEVIDALGTIGYARVDSDYEEIAGFANVTLHLADRFDLDLGGRYSHNNQSAHQISDGLLVGGFADFGVIESSEDVFTYSVAPRFALSDDASLYVRVAKGFRPGGPNILPPGAPTEFASYDSDSVISYEAGVKAQGADYLIELAAFHIDWDDIQLLTTQDGFNFNANGGGAKSDGVELSGTFSPLEGLTLSANGVYTNAKLTTDTEIGGLDGDRLPFTPKFSATLMADYSFPMGGELVGHVGGSYRHMSEQATGFDADYRAANGSQRAIDGYDTIDLSAGVKFGSVSIDAYAKNLGNSEGRTSATGTTVFGFLPLYPEGAIGTGVIRPRTFGLTLGMEY